MERSILPKLTVNLNLYHVKCNHYFSLLALGLNRTVNISINEFLMIIVLRNLIIL